MQLCLAASDGGSTPSRRGTRRTTSALLAADLIASKFGGLPAGVTRWTVMRALRLAAQALGLSARELQLLEVYIEHTFDADWIAGAEPIVVTPVVELAEALGVTERQIRNIEHGLMCRGLITFRDCGNHLRRGRRDSRTGQLIHGYGPSLAAVAARFTEIEALGVQASRDRAAARQSRLAIGALRRRIRADIEALREAGRVAEADAAAQALSREPARLVAATPLTELERRRGRLSDLASQLSALGVDESTAASLVSSRAEMAVRPAIQKSNREFLKEGSLSTAAIDVRNGSASNCAEHHPRSNNTRCGMLRIDSLPSRWPRHNEAARSPITKGCHRSSHGMERVALDMLVKALPVRFNAYVENADAFTWPTLVDAAAAVCRELKISEADWGEACGALGRNAAAVAVLLVDARTPVARKVCHGGVVNPAAYLRGMVTCGREGRLRLDASVFALPGQRKMR